MADDYFPPFGTDVPFAAHRATLPPTCVVHAACRNASLPTRHFWCTDRSLLPSAEYQLRALGYDVVESTTYVNRRFWTQTQGYRAPLKRQDIVTMGVAAAHVPGAPPITVAAVPGIPPFEAHPDPTATPARTHPQAAFLNTPTHAFPRVFPEKSTSA